METNHIIKVCGSITKKESIVPINRNILENTCIGEANRPYFNYYGNVPENPVPNSLFFFTIPFYSLEEVLRFVQKSDVCFKERINVAAAVLNFGQNLYPAIRIKNFPDYEHLSQLQKCFLKAGVQFAKKVTFEGEANVLINKCFIIKEVGQGIYFDQVEKNEGYVFADKLLNNNEFEELMFQIRNNSNCGLFDAAKCGIILDSEIRDVIRIFSEKLSLTLLKCIQLELKKFLERIS